MEKKINLNRLIKTLLKPMCAKILILLLLLFCEACEQFKISFEEPCQGGYIENCLRLARVELAYGNLKLAHLLFNKACKFGNAEACTFVSQLRGKNKVLGRNSCNLYCYEDDPENCLIVGRIIKKTYPDIAECLFQKLCLNGNVESCLELGMLKDELGATDRALKLFEQACNKKVSYGCFRQWILERNRNVNLNIKLKNKICKNSKRLCLKVMEYEFNNNPNEKNKSKNWAIKACFRGHVKACFSLSKHRFGKLDKELRQTIRKKLCDNGIIYMCLNKKLGS